MPKKKTARKYYNRSHKIITKYSDAKKEFKKTLTHIKEKKKIKTTRQMEYIPQKLH